MGIPISTCLSTATICSTKNLLFITTNPLSFASVSLPKNSHFSWSGFVEADHVGRGSGWAGQQVTNQSRASQAAHRQDHDGATEACQAVQ
jgi:hypothetical protein